ncbi:MAG TPA: YHS domain-containing protein [Polyangia bacterium]|nr:YHS domain-containing protein [Polyangia bacterium]
MKNTSAWLLATLLATLLAGACGRTQPAPAPTHEHEHAHLGAQAAAGKTPGAQVAFDGMPAFGTKASCPVSKETFTVTAKTQSSTYKGKTYVFCCPECKPDFEANPAKYVN